MPLQQPSYLSCVFSEVKGQAWDPRQPLSVTPVTTVHIVVTSWLTLRASVSGFSIRFALFSFKRCPRLPDKCLCIKFNSSDLILPLIRVIVSHIFHPLRGSKPLFAASTAPFPLSSCSLGVSLQSYLPDGFDPCPFSPLGPGAHLPLVLSPAVAPVCPHPVAALGVSSRRKSLSASALLGPQTFSRAQGGRSRQSEPSVTAAPLPACPPTAATPPAAPVPCRRGDLGRAQDCG